MKNIEIRKAEVNDAEKVVDVNFNSWETTYGGIFKQDVFERRKLNKDKNIAWWKQHLAGEHDVYVALVAGKLVGYMDFYRESRTHEGYAEIASIYILKDYQKMGIGRRFFEIAIELTKQANKTKFMLNVLDRNSSLGFYKKMGGKIFETLEIEKSGDKFIEDVMSFDV